METIPVLLILLILLNVALLVAVLVLLKNKKNQQTNAMEMSRFFQGLREELQLSVNRYSDSTLKRMSEISALQNSQFENIRKTVENRLHLMQQDNNRKLEEMRMTVDEKLHTTLERRLGDAFKQVGDRLEKVHRGLGEMHDLAVGVGDLKKVLTTVKSRGMLGEIQLENQLSQLLSPEQYEKNVKTRQGSNDFVEFAIKLPGKKGPGECVWLPVDSKFHLENYELLLNAYDSGDRKAIESASMKLVADIKSCARLIRDKYIDPPGTTDFALMYLPVEGLYAEVLRIRGLFQLLQRDYRVVPVGPVNLAALLNSLQMGFKTLAIEKHSSDVWKLLGAVKTHFGKFGDLLEKTRKKLDEAGKSIDDASRKSRYIEGRLNRVQESPPAPDEDDELVLE